MGKFKGEGARAKKKRRHVDEGKDGAKASTDGPNEEVPVNDGTGRIVSDTVTVRGFETKFKEECDVGDEVMVLHPTSLEVEFRTVTAVLSQRSIMIHQGFSKDLVS